MCKYSILSGSVGRSSCEQGCLGRKANWQVDWGPGCVVKKKSTRMQGVAGVLDNAE